MGTVHLEINRSQQGTANRLAEQLNLRKENIFESNMPVRQISEKRSDYSYLSASTGSNFDARRAGTKPLAIPTTSKAAVESSTVMTDILR
jgi:hypothetical protein